MIYGLALQPCQGNQLKPFARRENSVRQPGLKIGEQTTADTVAVALTKFGGVNLFEKPFTDVGIHPYDAA